MSFKGVVASYLQCARSRLIVLFVYTWPALISFLMASRSFPQATLLNALKLMFTVTMMGFGVYFYNDLTDINDDLKNLELGNPTPASRPFGSGEISGERLKQFVLFSSIASLLVAYSISLNVLGLTLAYLILGFLYSTEPIQLKKRYLMKQLIIAVGTLIVVLVGAYTAGGFATPILYMMVLHFIICMGLNPLLDIRDVRGDRMMGVKSIPVIWGPEMTIRLYFASIIIIGGATLVGYSSMGFNLAMPLLVLMIVGAWIYVSLPLLRRWDDPVFLNYLAFKRILPFYLVLQLVPLVGLINLPL
jgi:4-hydroxybenzoate polyprenyltransferase